MDMIYFIILTMIAVFFGHEFIRLVGVGEYQSSIGQAVAMICFGAAAISQISVPYHDEITALWKSCKLQLGWSEEL